VKVILQTFLIGKVEKESPFRRPVWVWEDNIEVDFTEFYQNGFWVFMVQESVEQHSSEQYNEP
jgi:hypothetical protein